jgi:hypothetical protein
MEATDIVSVDIRFTETVVYNASVRMTRERFDEINGHLMKFGHRADYEGIIDAQLRIDRSSNWADAHDLEITDFEIAGDESTEAAQ